MASNVQQAPFIKQLAANDRPTREKALSSLRLYLTSSREFSDLELQKLWKGLFFCLWHTDRPLPQQSLCRSLASLLDPLPPYTFFPFLRAFWTTITTQFSSIPSLRLDKYLLLIRLYVLSSFQYLSSKAWDPQLVLEYVDLISKDDMGNGGGLGGPLSVGDAKVPDGLRYHVLDVWVEEFVKVEGWEGVPEIVMGPIKGLGNEGRTKVLRTRAREVLMDTRLLVDGREEEADDREGSEEKSREEESEVEFEGFG